MFACTECIAELLLSCSLLLSHPLICMRATAAETAPSLQDLGSRLLTLLVYTCRIQMIGLLYSSLFSRPAVQSGLLYCSDDTP